MSDPGLVYPLWPYLACIAVVCALVIGASWVILRWQDRRARVRGRW